MIMARTQTQTKEKITQAAKTLLSLYGYQATTIDDVITASGITKGAFYHYFKSKEALCQAVVEQVDTEFKQLMADIPQKLPAIEKLRHIVFALAKLNFSGQWVNCRLMIKLMTEPHDESPSLAAQLAEFRNWYRGSFGEIIEQCRKDSSVSTRTNITLQLDSVMAIMMGSTLLNQMDAMTHSPNDFADQVLKLLKY